MQAENPIDLAIVNYLSHFRCYYPGILEWYSGLAGDLVSGRKRVFVSLKGLDVQGVAITKNGLKSKLCHISVSPSNRDRGLGRTLMSLAISDMASRGAQEIHVTTGEEVFREHARFFQSSGFRLVDWQIHRYRRGTSELIWQMDVTTSSLKPNVACNPEKPREFLSQVDASYLNVLGETARNVAACIAGIEPERSFAPCWRATLID